MLQYLGKKKKKLKHHIFFLRKTKGELEDASLDAVFKEDDSDLVGDDSDSDGYLSEVLSFILSLEFF